MTSKRMLAILAAIALLAVSLPMAAAAAPGWGMMGGGWGNTGGYRTTAGSTGSGWGMMGGTGGYGMMGGYGSAAGSSGSGWGMMGGAGGYGMMGGYGMAGGMWALHDVELKAAADALGTTVDALGEALARGQTLEQVAAEKGVPAQTAWDAVALAQKGYVEDLVKDGTVTADQAQNLLEFYKLMGPMTLYGGAWMRNGGCHNITPVTES